MKSKLLGDKMDFSGKMYIYNKTPLVFKTPGGPVVKNLPVNAGDTGSIPELGRSHMLWSSKVCKLQLLKPAHQPMLCNKRTHCNEKPSNHKQRGAPAHCNCRKPVCSNEDPAQPNINKN